MKTITLEEAHEILDNCSGVIAGDGFLTYPSVWELYGEDDKEFLYLNWTDDEGTEYNTRFCEGENREVKVSGCSLFLTDFEGDEMQITILVPQNFE